MAAKGYAIGVFINIEGAFDSTSNTSTKDAMNRSNIPETLIDWTQNMLKSRRLIVNHGNSSVEGRSAAGCPQGGVLSPLLWCLVVDELLTELKKSGFEIYGYADDVAIIRDPKLSWKPHLEENRKKFYTSMWACRIAMRKNWGLNLRTALWLYKMGGFLRAATGAMKTTPTEALQVALSIPSLNQVIKYIARQTAYKLKYQGEWKETRTGHTRLGLSDKHPFNLKQDRIPRRYQFMKTFKVQIPTREDWRKPNFKTNPNVDIWFTDGSGANGRYGAGIYGPNINHEGKSRKQIHIYTDSRAAIEALVRTTTALSVVRDCMQALTTLGGIPGNERADELARLSTEKVPTEQIVGVPFSAGTKMIKEWLEREHSSSWKRAVNEPNNS
ncbi:PREDICTED: uncharacterized protein LOC108782547 [Cyphomyrmex costatus]|uniref:uncharacterized protein LOC108782547 n=1 Tax=Cyphomyrmex costatus TaxID=456900 RepID=UPI0008523F72|nr:PREDICTED: uncharacterized protein LOC108782547 [Cyphomyrmex costatus]